MTETSKAHSDDNYTSDDAAVYTEVDTVLRQNQFDPETSSTPYNNRLKTLVEQDFISESVQQDATKDRGIYVKSRDDWSMAPRSGRKNASEFNPTVTLIGA